MAIGPLNGAKIIFKFGRKIRLESTSTWPKNTYGFYWTAKHKFMIFRLKNWKGKKEIQALLWQLFDKAFSQHFIRPTISAIKSRSTVRKNTKFSCNSRAKNTSILRAENSKPLRLSKYCNISIIDFYAYFIFIIFLSNLTEWQEHYQNRQGQTTV